MQQGLRILMQASPIAPLSDDFPTRLASVAQEMEATLGAVLPKPEGHQSVIMDAMRYAALGGGKRLRPFLMKVFISRRRRLNVFTSIPSFMTIYPVWMMMICGEESQRCIKPMMKRSRFWRVMDY